MTETPGISYTSLSDRARPKKRIASRRLEVIVCASAGICHNSGLDQCAGCNCGVRTFVGTHANSVFQRRKRVEMSLDAAGTSARATNSRVTHKGRLDQIERVNVNHERCGTPLTLLREAANLPQKFIEALP